MILPGRKKKSNSVRVVGIKERRFVYIHAHFTFLPKKNLCSCAALPWITQHHPASHDVEKHFEICFTKEKSSIQVFDWVLSLPLTPWSSVTLDLCHRHMSQLLLNLKGQMSDVCHIFYSDTFTEGQKTHLESYKIIHRFNNGDFPTVFVETAWLEFEMSVFIAQFPKESCAESVTSQMYNIVDLSRF